MNRFQVYRVAGETLRWRLVGGNNRAIALSPLLFASAEQAGEHVLLLRRLVDGGALSITSTRVDDGWTWGLDADVGPSAIGPAPFARRADARSAARRFLHRAGSAPLVPGVITHRVTAHPLSLCGRPVSAEARKSAL